MKIDRRISFGIVSLVEGKVRKDVKIGHEVKKSLDELIKEKNLLEGAPFKWVGLIYRYGTKNKTEEPEYQRINKKYGDLPIAIEVKMEVMQAADREDPEKNLKAIFMIGALDALIHVAKKYNLPSEEYIKLRSLYGKIPESPDALDELYP